MKPDGLARGPEVGRVGRKSARAPNRGTRPTTAIRAFWRRLLRGGGFGRV